MHTNVKTGNKYPLNYINFNIVKEHSRVNALRGKTIYI